MIDGQTPDEGFSAVFSRDDRDSGADAAAPVESGQPRDDSGRFAPKQTEATAEAAPAVQPEAKPEATPTPADTPSDQQSRHVPLPELLSEREKRKQEATRREEAEKRANDLQARLEAIERQTQQQTRQAQVQQEPAPDPYADPVGFAQYQQQQFEAKLDNERANMSEMLARQKYGDAVVDAASDAVAKAGANAAAHFLKMRDPYGALVEWHKKQSFLQKVGTDPEAYEKTIEQRAYERALADLRAGKAPTGQAQSSGQQPQRFPGSLASATATGSQAAMLTDEAAFSGVFGNRRA